jgi:hypothetical protein
MNAVSVAAWQGLQNRRHLGWWLLFGGSLVVLGLLGIAALLNGRAAWGAAIVMALLVVVGGWMSLVASLLWQNHPTLARLVPGHVQQLRQTATVVWLALALAVLVLSAWITGSPLRMGLPLATVLLVLAWTLRWPPLWALVWIPGVVWPLLKGWPPLAALGAVVHGAATGQPWLTAGLGLVLGCWCLQRLFQVGGAAHDRYHRQMRNWRKSISDVGGRRGVQWRPGSVFERLQRPGRRAYAQAFEQALARPDPGVGRVLLALGPPAQARVQAVSVLGLVVVLGVLIVGLLVAQSQGWIPPTAELSGAGNVSFGALAFCLGLVSQIRAGLVQTRAEQGLLALAPGGLHGPVCRRRMAARLMLQYQALCGLAFGALALLLSAASLRGMADAQVWGFWSIAALSGLALWGDWSRWQPVSGFNAVFSFPILAAMVLLAALHMGWLGLGAWLLVAGAAGLAAGLWRWRVVTRRPG